LQRGLGSAIAGPRDRSERRLVQLLFARLSLTLLSFGIAIGLDGLGRELPLVARQGLYWTVAAAFATTVVSAILLGRAQRIHRFVAAQIATDVAIVTSLVHYSGGRESVFTFLYVVVTLYGAVLFERRGAMLSASLSAMAYGALLFGAWAGWLPVVSATAGVLPLPLPVLIAIWGVHVGALYLVGVLASLLSSELQRTGRALDQSTSDLRRLHDLHQRTVESIMSGLLTMDAEGRVTSFNPEAERITGISSEVAMGRHFADLIPDARDIVDCNTGADARREVLPRTRIPYRNAAGEELFLGVAASVLRDSDSQPLGHVVIFQDVTGVVAMERELRASERMAAVGEMAAKIAHEIRNPLASISGSIQILAAGIERDEPECESGRLMDIVVRETDRLNSLITDFLQYSSPTPPNAKQVAVQALLHELTELLDAARPDDVRLDCSSPLDLAVYADPDQLKQVLWNLCLNAVESMPDGGVVRISARHVESEPPQAIAAFRRNGGVGTLPENCGDHPWVEIAIQDAGIGIPPDVQERIFEPFFTTKREGTGLGLATVHRIVESHGGGLLWSSEEGAGTTFRVLLPGKEERI